jgi:hypothetical protein
VRRRILLALSVAATLAACSSEQALAPDRASEQPRLFLSGDGELWVVDVAAERARRLRMTQLAGGDPPVRILRRDDGLVLWGYDVWRLDPRAPQRPPRRILRRGWFFIASAHPDRVWVALLDPRSPATVRALRAVREITVDGKVTVRDTRPPHGAWPQLAVRAGLLFGTRRGDWYLWDPTARRVVRRWAQGALGYPGAAYGDLIASCPEPCTSVRLTDVRTGVQRRAPAPRDWKLRIWDSAFSPSGRTLAVPAQRRGRTDGPTRLALVDVARGQIRLDRPAGLHLRPLVAHRRLRSPHRWPALRRPRDRRLPPRRAAGPAAGRPGRRFLRRGGVLGMPGRRAGICRRPHITDDGLGPT